LEVEFGTENTLESGRWVESGLNPEEQTLDNFKQADDTTVSTFLSTHNSMGTTYDECTKLLWDLV